MNPETRSIPVSALVKRLSASQRGLLDRLPPPAANEIYALAKGDPSFATPSYIVDAAIDAMRSGHTHYPPADGDRELRVAVARYESAMTGAPLSASDILITVGATQALSVALMAIFDAGDEILVFDPSYSIYSDLARALDLRIVPVPVCTTPRESFERALALSSPRAKAVIVNFPANPTGQTLAEADLDALAALATEKRLLVISDEVYDQIVFRGTHLSPMSHPRLIDRTILINSVSKTYAMTGWRVGWIAASSELIPAMASTLHACFGPANSIAMRAAAAALLDIEEDTRWRAEMLERYRERRAIMGDELSRVPGIEFEEPAGAFYYWARYRAPVSSVEIVRRLYAQGLAVRPGVEFGERGEQHLRITFASDVTAIRLGIAVLRRVLTELEA